MTPSPAGFSMYREASRRAHSLAMLHMPLAQLKLDIPSAYPYTADGIASATNQRIHGFSAGLAERKAYCC